ncbi:BTAD domain-containing putative transcriptional regulator [Paractinoplanes hotanensis]|uniref:AAA family ATPase n=1 Tax=Paractinoplanes hotanensis TaxID=2906497 RepID=A0ABT0XW74_9ACTN|nr:BTAD domain-containing putative transcriptional regulator [Actinoplanes hotanensis]MCM4078041.1 AAA family ATPase [Actinoplanes hotanensis]
MTGEQRLTAHVLGPVRAWIGEREPALGAARQRALFALLATAAGRFVSRDELIAGIWSTSPPATAAGSIYTYISGLRRVLGAGLLISGPGGYALRVLREDVDSERFAALCDEAAGQSGERAAALLDEALRLWQGDEAYAGLSGHRFELARARLAEQRLAAVEQRARVLTELGDDGVVAELTGLIRDHPLHEPLHELLMTALDRAGRHTEALEVYRSARRTLRTELGVEPSARFTESYERMRAPVPEQPVPSQLPPQVARMLGGAPPLAGRKDERSRLRGLVRDLTGGQGAAVWIEGEPGIGKSELLTAAFADVGSTGVQIGWAIAVELDQHVPRQVLIRALGLEESSLDHRVAAVAAALRTDGDDEAADRLLAYVRAACAIGPLLLVVDDLQWADPATLVFWDRLVALTRRLPLLLVAAARPEPEGRELTQLRRRVEARHGHLVRLGALPPEAVDQLVVRLVGAPLGPNLGTVVSKSGGNPLCAAEMTTALLRRGLVRVAGGQAEIPDSVEVRAPGSLLAMMYATVELLSPATREVLRMAALLGAQFTVEDLVAVTGRSPFDLIGDLEEALSADIVVDAGPALAFRHPFLRQALHDGITAGERAGLHRHTAEVLARRGVGAVTRVAEQLAAETPVIDDWVVSWLVQHHAEIVRRTPRIAGELLRAALGSGRPGPRQRETLLIALVKLDFRYERWPIDEAREAAGLATDPADRAEMRQLLAAMMFRREARTTAISLLEDAMSDARTPAIWHTRHRVLLANFHRGPLDDLDRADRTAAGIHRRSLAAGRLYEAAYALQTSWLTNSIRRDHERALAYADQALALMLNHPDLPGMYLDLLDNRMFTLQNLDRLDEAEQTLRSASLYAIRHQLTSGLPVASAVQFYWRGRWDDAMAEVSAATEDAPGVTFLGMREPGAVGMLLHGVGALIAARRDDPVLARAHLDQAETLPASDAERESCDFLLVARALVAEQQGRADDALEILGPLLVPEYAPLMLRHQWLPAATRLALTAGRRDLAERAGRICAEEAAREVRPARAFTAAARCRALLTGDPEPALAAAAQYRTAGRVAELASALEDAAVLLATARRPHEAARTGGEAAALFERLGARWDGRRIRRRLAEYGVGPAGPVSAE